MPDHQPHVDSPEQKFMHARAEHFYTELARITSILFVGVLATMTFLLTVGFQRPHADFEWALYATIITLALNLIAYVVGHIMSFSHKTLAMSGGTSVVKDTAPAKSDSKDDAKDKDSDKLESYSPTSKKSPSRLDKSRSRLQAWRIVQMVLFVLAVCCVVWLALATAQFFFTIPTTSSGGVQAQ